MIPYVCFSFMWVAPFMIYFGYREVSYLYNLILGQDCRHLWYVWMLFNVFVSFYLVRFLFVKFNIPLYCLLIISLFVYIYREKVDVGGMFQIEATIDYQLYFTVGYLAFKYKKTINVIIPFFICVSFLLSKGLFSSPLLAFAGIYVFLKLSPCFVFLNSFFWGGIISRNSFGIYLFHPIIIYFLFHYLGCMFIPPVIMFIIIFVVSTGLSILFTEITRYLKMGVIIGE